MAYINSQASWVLVQFQTSAQVLSILCVSAVRVDVRQYNRRDAKNAKVAQRRIQSEPVPLPGISS